MPRDDRRRVIALAIRRKFASSSLPAVGHDRLGMELHALDDGARLWRTPMISSSQVFAVTSSASGSDSGAITSEW